MNKKIAALAAASLLFAACSGSNGGSSDGSTTNSATVDHDGSEITATVTKDKDGKITAVDIDEVTEDGDSKKELGSDYGMKKASGIGKEWNEQVEYLENYIVENGVDAVKLDSDGYAENEDVKSGATINLSSIMEAVDKAAAK